MIAPLTSKLKLVAAKAYWKEILAVLMLLLAIVFFRSERKELHAIIPHLRHSDPLWLMAGAGVTLLYFFLQGGMYKKSFDAIGLSLPWGNAVILFLKRNLISIFLPAGGVSALAYSPSQIRKAGYDKTRVHQASGLFGFAGLLTVVLAALPVLVYTLLHTSRFRDAWAGLASVLLMIGSLVAAVRSFRNKGMLHRLVSQAAPSLIPHLNELFAANVNIRPFAGAVTYSLGVELSGMIHIYIAMLALGVHASFGAAASAYIIAVLLMVVSPFLRGLGAVELSMVYVLKQFGYTAEQALSVTILYRVFEFWLPLLAGLFTYAWKGKSIFLRIAPALLTFALGIVNILSAITPPIRERVHLLRRFFPLSTIHASNTLVLFAGLSSLVTAAFLVRGLRTAWVIALVLSVLSLVGNVTKALDYEEAILASVTVGVLLATAGQYRIRSSNRLMKTGVQTAAISLAAVLVFNFISFYFLDRKHFGIDFTWKQSVVHTFKSFLLVQDDSLHPLTRFGGEFIRLVRSLGFITWCFLLYTLIRPALTRRQAGSASYQEKARLLLSRFGDSTTDYFKLHKDKLYYFSDRHEAFVAYRIARSFAIVLEEPVCAEENKAAVLAEFDRYCRRAGLKTAFYRVDEESIARFSGLKKNKLMIGQEAILEISNFSLEGKDRKSLRNGLNSLQKKGYITRVHPAPQQPDFLLLLKDVSDEWLEYYDRQELIFSQGMFEENELRNQDIITVEDAEGIIKAFLNIIPSYADDECTYDLIRKTNDAPGAAMDALIVALIGYARAQNNLFLNLGLVPMTGISEPGNTPEQLMRLAAARIKRFRHYQGLREFKEKYATLWQNKYLLYDHDFDLLQLPRALNNVMKP